jgi:hypothetical protein
MTTLGGLALIMCAFIVPPIVLLHRSRITSRWIWLPALPTVALGMYLGLFLGPVLFEWMLRPPHWPSAAEHRVMLVVSFGFALLMSLTLLVVKRRDEKNEIQRKAKIQKAIHNIVADGVVEGPKGPYVPHEKWAVGTDITTPRETKAREPHGPYGTPMP